MLKAFRISIFIIFSTFLVSYGQVTIIDSKKLDQIKNGTTYILVKSATFPKSTEFLAAAQKNWTLTKDLKYLPGNASTIQIEPGDSFLSLEALTTRNAMSTGYVTNIYYYLSFWTCKDRFFNKNRVLKQSDHDPIAEIALSVDQKAFDTKKFFNTSDFDGSGLLYNWSPGMLRNYLQQMQALLTAKKKVNAYDDILNKAELAKLAKETLYIPDFNLLKFNAFFGRNGSSDEENIIQDYKLPSKVVSKEELEKIISSDKPSYYLIFIKNSSQKIVCVINSLTGETIYSEATALSYNLKAGDLKSLRKKILDP